MNREDVEGFGAPKRLGTHKFTVHIPTATKAPVTVVEEYGFLGGRNGVPDDEPRAVISRRTWVIIRDAARLDFNPRLRERKLPTGVWSTGKTPVDHLLGKELCVLAWGSEGADKDAAKRAASAWSSLRPEERWWLFSATVTMGGRPNDQFAGWRQALRAALQDDTSNRRKTVRPEEEPAEAGRLFL